LRTGIKITKEGNVVKAFVTTCRPGKLYGHKWGSVINADREAIVVLANQGILKLLSGLSSVFNVQYDKIMVIGNVKVYSYHCNVPLVRVEGLTTTDGNDWNGIDTYADTDALWLSCSLHQVASLLSL